MLKDYYKISKPGIIYGNLLSALSGFFLASRVGIDWAALAFFAVGLSLVIASACALNNVWDRGLDAKMQRTKNRPTATGKISAFSATVYGLLVLVLGAGLLFFKLNAASAISALVGWAVYVLIYTPLKIKTRFATELGSLSGAMPPVAGYAAALGKLDAAAAWLFLFMILWQMPHFYAISLFRLKDYEAAGVPAEPLAGSVKNTKTKIKIYIVLVLFSILGFWYFGYVGKTFLAASGAAVIYWLIIALKNVRPEEESLWAKKVFRVSLLVLLVVSVFAAFGLRIP